MIAGLVSQKQGNGTDAWVACPRRIISPQRPKNRFAVGFRRVLAYYNV